MQTITLFDENFKPLLIESGIPALWAEYAIPGAEQFHVDVHDCGIMLFQLIATKKCDIWVSNYIFDRSTTIYCKSKSDGVEFHNIVTGHVLFKLNDQNWQLLKAGEHNVLYNQKIDSAAIFNIEPVTTLDFHLNKRDFRKLVQDQPAFKRWLQQMRQGIDLRLYANSGKTPLQIQGLIAELAGKFKQSPDISDFAMDVVKAAVDNASAQSVDNCRYRYSFEEVKKILSVREKISQAKHHQVNLANLIRESLIGYKKFVEGFKLIYTMSPAQFLFNERIKQCKSLLLGRNKFTNEDIAQIMDFNSGSHFASTFKRVVHCTPMEYRRKYMSAMGRDN